jgi:GH24 family phage-related lysozyme (muramidase)
MDLDKLTASIKLHEGSGPISNGMYLPYEDSLGNKTIAFGHLLSRGVSENVATIILGEDIALCIAEAQQQAWWPLVEGCDARARSYTEILYNVGLTNLDGFSRALAATMQSDWSGAAAEFRASVWYSQVGNRAVLLCNMIETGLDPTAS